MKVLLSAYACEPNKGSEPGVGWNWVIEVARLGHEVWVLTRSNNQEVIEAELAKGGYPKNLHFLYYDLPNWAKWWKKGGRGIYLYYLLWQWGAYKKAKSAHKKISFDLVHHITFGVIRQPSFIGRLDIPFIFGPVGGGERAPWCLRKNYGFRGHIKDILRDILNFFIKFDPMMQSTFRKANIIYVKTRSSQSLVPIKYYYKTRIQLEIGIYQANKIKTATKCKKTGLRLLYVGRFLYWKGMSLSIHAVALALKSNPNIHLTMIGKGSEEKRWRRLCDKLGISDHVEWLPWLPQKN